MLMTRTQAADTWCPMVRIARHEVIEARQTDGPDGAELTLAEHHIVGGINHDALGARGNARRMAAAHEPLASCRCIADKCAMWRWVDSVAAVFVPRDQDTWWPIEDEPLTEPAVRVAGCPADAVWVPLSGEGEELTGGYWEEPADKVAAENDAARATAEATMRGFCGLAGRPGAAA